MNQKETQSEANSFRLFLDNDSRRPFLLRYSFAFVLFVLTVVLGFLFLPLKAPLTGFQKTMTAIVMAISFFALMTVVIDDNKSMAVRIAVSCYFVLQVAYLIVFYTGVDFQSLAHVFANRKVMEGQWKIIFDGLGSTLHISLYSIVFGTLLGLLIAVLRQLKNRVVTAFLTVYLNFFRIMPQVVSLFIVYFGLPYAKILISPFVCSVLVLSMSSAAFISEIFRGGIEAIHKTQIEASRALGLSFFQTMRLVVIPQAFKIVIPSLANEWVGIIKDTSICSLISVTDLLKAGRIISISKANPTSLIVAAGIYLVILFPLTLIVNSLEKKQQSQTKKYA